MVLQKDIPAIVGSIRGVPRPGAPFMDDTKWNENREIHHKDKAVLQRQRDAKSMYLEETDRTTVPLVPKHLDLLHTKIYMHAKLDISFMIEFSLFVSVDPDVCFVTQRVGLFLVMVHDVVIKELPNGVTFVGLLSLDKVILVLL
ncbi:hypothetical protein Tco_1165865 [Tanacetum coccineum]